MAAKPKPQPLSAMHTAGIFSDMTVDGPEIGTLVLVVDRAKNLPNRKTIGKQDPYCAARLGKEAKKTTTDIRGGQTPKWQEIRFTVHDSPDYFQLKVSVFNDDKKTELIGETWIDLRDIVVPSGGQSDQWHQLGCRGKYAGEVRIEITYYDSRPKPEKPAVKAKPPFAADADPGTPAAAGPRPVPKRRPLPSDPVTGKSPAPPSPAPEHEETPPPARPQPAAAPVPQQQQPPPQPEQYNSGPPAPTQQQYYDQHPNQPRQEPSREFGTPSRHPDPPTQQYHTPDRPDQYEYAVQHHDQGYSPHYQQQGFDRRDSYGFGQNDMGAPEDDRPPPPPAHRSRTGSNPSMNAAFQATPPTMRQDVLRSEAHRNSVSGSYPGRPTYKAQDPPQPAAHAGSHYSHPDQVTPSRHYSYDLAFDQNRTMQATVEDVPESPDSANPRRRTSGWAHPQAQQPQHFDPEYDMSASPAPLSLAARPDPRYQEPNGGYQMDAPDVRRESADYGQNYGRYSEPSLPSHAPHPDQRALTYRGELDDTSNSYSAPPVPASLVPGVDPNIAQEMAERMNQDRRQSTQQRGYNQQALVETPRGRSMNDRYGQDASPGYNAAPPAHGRSPVTYTNGPSTSSVNVVIKSRAYSPNPPRDPSPNPLRQTIRRKSVSPRPPTESNRLSGVPFGPDSYNSLNPSASSAALRDDAAARPDYHEETGKIITHDGRHVDPSDHLPMETWAPEPEAKQPSAPAPAARPSPSGPQPTPPPGRRPLRVAGRPQSMLPAPTSSAITFSGSDFVEPVTTSSAPVSAGRNRLQKKAAYRQSTSAVAPVMSGAIGAPVVPTGPNVLRRNSGGSAAPAPLAQIDNFTPPRQMQRASTFEYGASENHAPGHHQGYQHHHSHSGGAGGGGGGAYGTSPGSHASYGQHSYNSRHGGPPIPAKVPLALPAPTSSAGMSGALQLHSSSVARRAGMEEYQDRGYQDRGGYHGQGGYQGGGYGAGGGGAMSLEEEMRQIDIGTGRSSRRHVGGGGGYGY
ncbi:hypothetical protein C8A05DRAFT_45455 [Staphylotrichum tortipilum]|uniref:C2 domain-containing protein n=1 Tax=Staphylotrichum tortipilum TaxID=2831512 RepID=A0AAN6MHP4_9PEZI|nr:hypothetical protein C8A05DRAFT_45455 [Staphylotrichum longicolle]